MTPTMLANHVWQSTIVAGVAWLITLALRRDRAGARHAVWLAASLKFLVPFALLVSVGGQLGWRTSPISPQPQVAFVMDVIGQPFSGSAAAVVPVIPATRGAIGDATRIVVVSLLVIWLVGVAAVLMTWWVRWRHVAAIVCAGTPANRGPVFDAFRRLEALHAVGKPLALVVSDASLEPGVFGILKPVLVWPRQMSEHLAETQIEAILAHELAHVRRRDNLASAAHMVVQAIFWFHPLVWWLGARLVDERERACDEEVVRLGSDPRTYAESILKTCQFYVESPLACVAGVTGSNLKKRIEHIMTNDARTKLNGWKKCLLSSVVAAGTAVPVLAGALNAPRLAAQSADGPEKLPVFEAASVKVNNSGEQRTTMRALPGRIEGTNRTLKLLIQNAYRLQDFQVVGGPDWLNSARFDISARAEGSVAQDQLRLMLQQLLADRFRLTAHTETREMLIYALTRVRADGKTGSQLRPSDADCSSGRGDAPRPANPPPGQAPRCGFRVSAGNMMASGVDMGAIAVELAAYASRPIADRTGLAGRFDFTLNWTPEPLPQPPAHDAAGSPAADPNLPSLFSALQEQLGLKLDSTRGSVDVLVIDRAEQPTEN